MKINNFKMKFESFMFVFSVQLLFNTYSVSGKWPDDLEDLLPYLTPSPLAIKTNNVKIIKGMSSLKITGPPNNTFEITNNKKTIVATIIEDIIPTRATGTVLKDKVYKLFQIFAIFNNEPTDRCGTTVDGKGSTIEMVHILKNEQYEMIEEAKTKRDGILALVHRIGVEGYINNTKFEVFGNILKKLIEPGSSHIVPGPTIFGWYSRYYNATSYFLSPGSYIEPFTGTRYQCAITCTFDPVIVTISLPQFKYYQNLRAMDGTPLTNTASTYAQGEIPVIQAEGIEVNIV